MKLSILSYKFIFSQQTIVNKDASELRTNRLVQQSSNYRGIHTAGKAADHPALADLGADLQATDKARIQQRILGLSEQRSLLVRLYSTPQPIAVQDAKADTP